MNKFETLLAIAAAITLVASCDSKKNDPVTPDTPKDVVVPETMIEAYYVGDYYGTGTSANVFVNFISGNIDLNEDETVYIGTGQVLCLDLNVTLPASVEEADHLSLPAGTYMVADDTHAPLTWNPEESYLLKVENDEVIADREAFKSGTITIEKTGKGSKLVFSGELKSGTTFTFEYEGIDRVMSHADDSKYSNLDNDVDVKTLVSATYSSLGDVVGDGKTETWVISLGDKYYDFEEEYGNGESILLFLNVKPGSKEIPEGKVTEFADLNFTEVLEPNTFIAGYFMWGTYGGNWYKCPAYAYEAALVGGEVEFVKGENNTYSIKGTLLDAYGKKVSFSYNGEVKQMVYEED